MQNVPAKRRVEPYRELDAWKKGMRLASAVYEVTRTWPHEERFGLPSQIRRAAISIPCNVAEGQGRQGKAELRHHLSIAHGSLCEVETLLHLAVMSAYSTKSHSVRFWQIPLKSAGYFGGSYAALTAVRVFLQNARAGLLLDASTSRLGN